MRETGRPPAGVHGFSPGSVSVRRETLFGGMSLCFATAHPSRQPSTCSPAVRASILLRAVGVGAIQVVITDQPHFSQLLDVCGVGPYPNGFKAAGNAFKKQTYSLILVV